nr:TonB-dependent siderophore receptor [uncultured Desulfuromonas sp.]
MSLFRPKSGPATHAVLAAFVLLFLLIPLQTATAAELTHTFAIEAGPLDTVLNQFVRASGVNLSYADVVTDELHSDGVSGRYTSEEALHTLLDGTGITAEQQSGGGFRLRQQTAEEKAQEVQTLQEEAEPMTVTASSVGDTTEGTGSYTTGAMNTATKMDLSIRETPQSVSVITRQKIEDENYQTIDEALSETTGLYVSRLGTTRWEYISRGSTIDNIQYDGVSSHIHYYARDVIGDDVMDMYDRIEVVRGATGLTQGAGDPSASINMVRKRPTAEQQTSLSGNASMWGNGRMSFDTSGSFNQSQTIRGRLVASASGGDDCLDESSRENQLYYAVLDADVTEKTLLSLGFSHQKTRHDGYSWGGLATHEDGSFYDLDPEDTSAADWEYLDREENVTYFDLEQALGGDWNIKLSGRYSKAQSDMLASYTWWASSVLYKYPHAYEYDHRAKSADLHLSGSFNLFGRKHKLVLGANFDDEELSYVGGSGTAIPIDLETWDPSSVSKPDIALGSYSATYDQQQYGVYSALQLNPHDRINLTVGLRVSWFDYSTESVMTWGASASDYEENAYILPYYGITCDLTDTLTAYASYTEIFQPQQNYDIDGDLLPPEEGNNKEVGVKFESSENLFNASIAFFETNRDNLATALDGVSYCNPGFSTCYEAAERVRTRGFELDASGELSDGWHISAGYTYSKSEYVEGENKGDHYYTYNIPKHSFKLSTVYDLPGRLHQLSVGAGMKAQSELYKTGDGYRIEQGGYVIFDAMAKYQLTPRMKLQLNINNLLDKEYYSSLSGTGTSYGPFMGDPRNIVLSFKYQF